MYVITSIHEFITKNNPLLTFYAKNLYFIGEISTFLVIFGEIMGSFNRKLQSMFNTKAKSLNDLGKMSTHKLPIPDIGGNEFYMQFTATCDGDGFWSIDYKTNCKVNTSGLRKSIEAFHNAQEKTMGHFGANGKQYFDFDSAYIILREMEEAHMAYHPSRKRVKHADNATHFSHAEKLVPNEMMESLEKTYQATRNASDILPKPAHGNIPTAASKNTPPQKK